MTRAFAIPAGSKARTRAPMSWSAVMSASEGASRKSSVLGLKESPRTATVLPRSEPENMFATLRAMARFRISFAAAIASTMRRDISWSWPVLIRARIFLGKQGPPEARSAMKNFSADTMVQADAVSHLLNICAHFLAQIGDFVDESDLG